MKRGSLILAALALAGCAGSPIATAMTPPEKAAEEDDAKCQSFGAQKGTPAYTECRVYLDAQREQKVAAWRRSVAGAGQSFADGIQQQQNNQAMIAAARESRQVTCTSGPFIGNTVQTTCR